MGLKENVMLSLDKVLLRMIEERVEKIGKGCTKSGWINDALHKQLKNELGFGYIGKYRKYSRQPVPNDNPQDEVDQADKAGV